MVLPGYPAKPFETAEDVEAHIGGETVLCLMCGKPYENVLLHARRTHQMSEPDYRQRFNVPWSFSLAGAKLSDKRRAVATRPSHIDHIRRQRTQSPRTGPLTPLGREAKRRASQSQGHRKASAIAALGRKRGADGRFAPEQIS